MTGQSAEDVAPETWAEIVAEDPDTKTPEYRAAYAEAARDAEAVLLRRVLDEVGSPWFTEAYEGFNDGCVFCGSQDSEMSVWRNQMEVSPYTQWHKPTCLWFDIHAHLGLEVPPPDRQRGTQIDGSGSAE